MRLILASICLAFFLPSHAGATGLAVSPSSLTIKTGPGGTNSADFTVSNPDNQIQVFEIYADDFQNLVRINPPVFTLSPGGIKKVSVEIAGQSPGRTGSRRTTISVVGHPLAGKGTQIAAGGKISLTITDASAGTKIPAQNLLVGLVALGSLIAAAAWQKLRKD